MKPTIAPSEILAIIEKLPGNGNYWLAYSGGLDSTALLHLLVEARKICAISLTAVHINHKISKNADLWARHCQEQCENLGVKFICKSINVSCNNEQGMEAHARELRYAAISEFIGKDDVLLTAHHRDDLVETVLLHLIRGSGPDGLAGIPFCRRFSNGWVARPLLGISREQLLEYVHENKLFWVEDESNLEHHFDRNYIRQKVLPVILQRWPSAGKTIARAARHQSEVSEILAGVALADLKNIQGEDRLTLNIDRLCLLEEPRVKNVIRYWIRDNHFDAPNEAILNKIVDEVIHADIDSLPCMQWKDTEVRRYRKKMYLMHPEQEFDNSRTYQWDLGSSLDIGFARLQANRMTGEGIRLSDIKNNTIEIRFRQGGEKIHPAGRHETHELKKLFQEEEIPPWERNKIPLLFIEGKLAAVAGYWIDKSFAAASNEPSWNITLLEKSG